MTLLEQLRVALPDGYLVGDYIDEGGQGSVFAGELRGERVALKLFSANTDPRRIQREVEALSTIDCPNLVKLRAAETVNIDGAPFPLLAYEYLGGGDLRQYLRPDARPIAASELITIGLHVGTAIEALWSRRICHRDIKPANVVRTIDGRYVLVDVGFGRHLDRSNITVPGNTAGTFGYMSPEQFRGRADLTVRSDVFSLGVTLYELAAQRHPFNGNQYTIGTITPPDLSTLRSDLSQQLRDLIRDMLSERVLGRPTNIMPRLNAIAGA